MSCFIDYNNTIYLFHGVSSGSDFPAYSGFFETTMKNFSVLKDSARINVVPKRIHLKQVIKAGTLTEALAYYKVPQSEMEKIALLNNLKLTDRVESKKLIKLIGK